MNMLVNKEFNDMKNGIDTIDDNDNNLLDLRGTNDYSCDTNRA
jgi:hypothetical protein